MRSEKLKIDFKKKYFKADLNGITFMEGDSHIIYLPSLRMSGYGDTFKEANDLLKASLKSFSDNLLEFPEHKVFEILKELGWERNKIFKRQLNNLSETTFEDIKREFNLPDTTSVHKVPIAV